MVHGASGGGNLVCRLLRHLPFRYHPLQSENPGRDSEVASSIEKAVAGAPGKSGYNVPAILEALGGADNIVSSITALPVCVCL